jgi:hypothetical protein
MAKNCFIPSRPPARPRELLGNVLSVVLESSTTLVVVSAIQGLTFNMIPVTFMPGHKMWRANRLGWFVLAVVALGFFLHVLVVQDEAGFSATSEHGTVGLLVALGVCVGLTASVWGFFAYRRHGATTAQAPPTTAATQPTEAGPE